MLSGRLSDRLARRKPFAVTGYALSAFVKPLLAFATAPWHVLLVRFADRLGKGVREAPRDALLSISVEQGMTGRAFGFHKGADTLGAAVGPLVAVLILPLINNNLRTLFLWSFVASICALLIVQIFVRDVSRQTILPAFVPEEKRPAEGFRLRRLWSQCDTANEDGDQSIGLGLPYLIYHNESLCGRVAFCMTRWDTLSLQ